MFEMIGKVVVFIVAVAVVVSVIDAVRDEMDNDAADRARTEA